MNGPNNSFMQSIRTICEALAISEVWIEQYHLVSETISGKQLFFAIFLSRRTCFLIAYFLAGFMLIINHVTMFGKIKNFKNIQKVNMCNINVTVFVNCVLFTGGKSCFKEQADGPLLALHDQLCWHCLSQIPA